MVFIGTISLISWSFPLLLGASKGLNFTVSALEILITDALFIVATTALMLFLVQKFQKNSINDTALEGHS